ncbi:MAG: DUF885 domain-containing protein [Vicinamibacterales bacterium]|nr:DUF885 domain-containing protein [Vicinamibacterales bacterium]
MYSAEPLPHFVDHYLASLHEAFPTTAAGDGVHTHDDLLEDFSRAALDGLTRDLGSFGRRLDAMRPETLTPVQRLERPVLEAHIRARQFELEQVRTWERSPQLYAETLALSLAAQALFAYAPAEERARRVLSKLRQAPRLLQQAQENVKEPPGIFIKTALETLRGVQSFIERDLPRAFATVDELSLLGDLDDASKDAVRAIGRYAEHLETEVAPRTKGSFRLGRERFETKLKLEEGIGLTADKLLDIALRELGETQAEFKRVAAGKTGTKNPEAEWRKVKAVHPPAGQLVAFASGQLQELAAFITKQRLVTMPEGEVVVAPTPPFYRWTFASLWTPGPFESRALPTYFYLTDADPSWTPERQEEHLRDFSEATLSAIAMHEVYPGHFLHFQHVRKLESPLRKSIVFAPLSLIEGWAHYAEHLVVEQGFNKRKTSVKLGQLAESLVRLARLVVGIRLHVEDWSVEQGVRFFRDEAYLEEGSARREAERGTFDPSYVVYALGKLMLLKLRGDVQASQGDGFSLKAFHDTLLGNGLVPFPTQRRLMLGADDEGALLE